MPTWDQNGNPLTREVYREVESFVVDSGREYLKAEVKGIGQEIYLSRLGGPGRKIKRATYRDKKREEQQIWDVTASINKEYDPGPLSEYDEWEAELEIRGYFRAGPDAEQELTSMAGKKMKAILKVAGKEIPPLRPSKLTIKTNADPSNSSTASGWEDSLVRRGSGLIVEFSYGEFKYDVYVEDEEIEDFGESDD